MARELLSADVFMQISRMVALGLLTLALGLVFATRRPPRVLATATKMALSGNASPLPAAGAAAAGAAAATAA